MKWLLNHQVEYFFKKKKIKHNREDSNTWGWKRRKIYLDFRTFILSPCASTFFSCKHIPLSELLIGYFFSFLSQIGLEGEHLNIYKPDGLNNVKWVSTPNPPKNQPLTWYKVYPHGSWYTGEEIAKFSILDSRGVQKKKSTAVFTSRETKTLYIEG